MKKKLFSSILAALLVSSTSTTVFAAPVTEDEGSQSQDVNGVYAGMADADTVYSVDVVWGSMEFTYHAGTITKTWNPETHSYVETPAGQGSWSHGIDANKVTVTNHSNKALEATVTAQTTGSFTGITASVTGTKIDLADASVGATTTEAGTASKGSATINLSGALDKETVAKTKIGTVTVTISDK